jgi:alkylated DNA repair dioxygenase AlkB
LTWGAGKRDNPSGGSAAKEMIMKPALTLATEIMTQAEEAALIALIEQSGLSYSVYDPDNLRSSTSYGWKYDFAKDSFVPCAPMPEGFRGIAASAAAFADVAVGDLAECLLNRYETGAVIQPHFDKPVWDRVVGVSLGSAATMEFRRETDGGWEHAPVELPPRSMYLLAGDTRHLWQHSLPPVRATRWSITFRTFSEEGIRLRDRMASAA